MKNKGEILLYQNPNGETTLEVRLEAETLWLSQRKMSELFDKDSDTIGLHIKNIYADGELDELATTDIFSVVQIEGNREVSRKVKHYNLDIIISVGYRVSSKRGTQFRIWANTVLKQYLIQGYTRNEKRLKEQLRESLQELIDLSKKRVIENQSVKFDLNENIKNLLENELERDVSGFVFQIDVYAIKHIFKEHGNEQKKNARGQIAVRDADIFLVIDVLQEPDIVFDSGKNKLGKDTLTFVKSFEDKYVVIQEIREGRKTIALNSMRIFKTKRTKMP